MILRERQEERQDEGNSSAQQFHVGSYSSPHQHPPGMPQHSSSSSMSTAQGSICNWPVLTRHRQEQELSPNSKTVIDDSLIGLPNTDDWPKTSAKEVQDTEATISTQDLPASCDWPEIPNLTTATNRYESTTKGESPTSQGTIRTQDLPNTCDWPAPRGMRTTTNDLPQQQHSPEREATVPTQELPNTCDWPFSRPQHHPPSPESTGSILTEDLPDTCNWQLLNRSSTTQKMTTAIQSPKRQDTNTVGLAPNQHKNTNPVGVAHSNNPAINPNHIRVNEEDSATSTIASVRQLTGNQPTRQDDDTSTSTILPPLPISKPTRQNTNNNDGSTTSTILIATNPLSPAPAPSNPSSLLRHTDVPKSIPLKTASQTSSFASPLSTGTLSSKESPSPVKPTRKPWFQKKKRRKLTQTTLAFR
jgi:hypothetical protein